MAARSQKKASARKFKIPKNVEIHYQKNPGYRQIHVDGAIGGITTKGKVSINFYAERIVIPKSEEYQVTQEGKLGARTKVSDDSKNGLIREIEFGTYLDIETAKALKDWLEIKIEEHGILFTSSK
jgi:hypothetical protein